MAVIRVHQLHQEFEHDHSVPVRHDGNSAVWIACQDWDGVKPCEESVIYAIPANRHGRTVLPLPPCRHNTYVLSFVPTRTKATPAD